MTVEELQEQYIQEAEKSSTLQKKLSETENKLTEMQESRIENLMESFQKALYKQQNTNPTQRIYSPEEMKLFPDRGHAEPNLWLIAGKTAEFLLDLLRSVSRNCQNSRLVELTLANKGKPQYYLLTFDITNETKCFPLIYNLYDVEADLEPDPNVYCDFPSCKRRDTDTITETLENNADVLNEEHISTPASMSVTKAQSFYSSTEWAVKIDSTLNSYAPIPLPSQLNPQD
ncbi:hypothetical protein P5673_010414 [Acropora cervicornis]|uniref:Uncharacterized protein n=1 Tax=Acropora cervicornis TaxID=6130 RepID=A0AAD9QRI9_ACRCE|nr:hypothetical protein P5673_010414 [Acropora cervicornis]